MILVLRDAGLEMLTSEVIVLGCRRDIHRSASFKFIHELNINTKTAIGTPHTHHYDCAVVSINAGKHVLVEKPATSNLAEWEALVQLAKEKNVFLMEAMWTRFLPVTKAMKEVITSGELGELRVLYVFEYPSKSN